MLLHQKQERKRVEGKLSLRETLIGVYEQEHSLR